MHENFRAREKGWDIFQSVLPRGKRNNVHSERKTRRCGEQGEIPFCWICGGVRVNYHTLSDFRTAHVDYLDSLLTHGVAALMHEGLVDLERVAQDGMRVRAGAGSSSFRRKQTLEVCLREVKTHLQDLKDEQERDQC